MGKIYSGEKVFFPLKSSETVEGSYGNQALKFPAKILRKVFAHSPKVQKQMKISKNCFSEMRSSGHVGFVFDNPTEKFSRLNPHLLSLEIRELDAQISKISFSQNLPLRT